MHGTIGGEEDAVGIRFDAVMWKDAWLCCGDNRDVLPYLPRNSVDAVVTDPPYGIGFMGKEWDQPGSFVERRAERGKNWDHVGGNHNPCNPADAVRTRHSEGMKYGKFCEDWARGVFRVLKPGGHLVAFSGTRTYHRMVCAIEDAGFEIRDSLMWIYGSGFPKSHNIGEGWGTALKPAFEPIVLARKPLSEGTVAANVLKWGTGALNIDGCRVEGEPRTTHADGNHQSAKHSIYGDRFEKIVEGPLGRWPANVCHDGSDEVVGMFPTTSSGGYPPEGGQRTQVATYGKPNLRGEARFGGSAGSAARFFYSAKANARDRADSKHPTVKPIALMRWLSRLVTPSGGTILDPFAGSGTMGAAALAEGMKCILIEREPEYQIDIRRRLDGDR